MSCSSTAKLLIVCRYQGVVPVVARAELRIPLWGLEAQFWQQCAVDPPVPIPNTEVKGGSANDSAM